MILIVGAKRAYNAEFFYSKAFRELGHETLLVDMYDGIKRPFITRYIHTRTSLLSFTLDRLPVNRNVIEVAKSVKPDAVLIFKGEFLSNKALRVLSERYPMYLFYPDTYKFKSILKDRLSLFRTVFTAANSMEFYYELGARKVITVPWACDPDFHKSIEVGKKYDLTFIGTGYPERRKVIHQVKATVFGDFWPFMNANPPVYGEDYVRVINESRINLNLHANSDVIADAPNMRAFEVAGCGAFQISDHVPSVKKYFPEIPTFKTIKELRGLIAYYLGSEKEREEIAMKAQERCYKNFKYSDSAKMILAGM
ncbi:MAG: glycosyltransferase [Conexivisphaerales archaeon]